MFIRIMVCCGPFVTHLTDKVKVILDVILGFPDVAGDDAHHRPSRGEKHHDDGNGNKRFSWLSERGIRPRY